MYNGKKCRLCGVEDISVEYDGYIRDGSVDVKTKEKVKMYRCNKCGVIWHDNMKDNNTYYESETYRKELENTSELDDFYANHDFECFDKFDYTGIDIYRKKTVVDIGCGGGGFLDFLTGVANEVIAVEPSKKYRDSMEKRGIKTFPYTSEASKEYKGKVDVVVSFDVIEHVEDPVEFIKDAYELLKTGGRAVIGTPTDAPVMRKLLGENFEENLLFSTQHIWVFNEKSLGLCAQMAGVDFYEVKYKQRYGMGNMISWLIEKRAMGEQKYGFVSSTMDAVWKKELEQQKLSDYILIYINK